MTTVNYILADNQDLSCMGFKYIISEQSQQEVSCVPDKAVLEKELIQHPSSLVVFDFEVFDWSSMEEFLAMVKKFPDAKWLSVIDVIDEKFIYQITNQLSDVNIVLKTASKEELSAALIASAQGKKYYCSEALDIILGNKKSLQEIEKRVLHLTPTEKEIVQLLAQGKTTKDIANERHLSYHTVITHRKNIFRKLELNSVHELTRYALKNGLADLTEYYI
jgi:NarL family two-component system response regulator LiaR